MSKDPIKTISTKVVYKNPWIKVREDNIIHSDGKKGIYGVMESKDSVMIVVLNELNEVYMVNKWSYPSKYWSYELPGGGSDGENLLEASKRELEEETGITAKTWIDLGKLRVCNGLMTEKMGVLLAKDLSHGARKTSDDHSAIKDGAFFSFAKIKEMIQLGKIDDGQSLSALYLAKQYIEP